MELSGAGLPSRAGCVVVGGGVLGLATAGALARRGQQVVLLEKDRVGAGASGIAGGIVRGYYRSPAMAEVVRRSVEVFERARACFGFRQVGYFAVVPERQVADLEAIAAQQAQVGHDSELWAPRRRSSPTARATPRTWRAPPSSSSSPQGSAARSSASAARVSAGRRGRAAV